MPEGDSVYRLARRMQFMVGKEVLSTSIRVPAFAVASFDGTTVERVWPHGKNLFMRLGDDVLHTHLKMEGTWSVHRRGTRWRKPAHTARVVLVVGGPADSPPIEVVGHDLGLVRVFPFADYDERAAAFGPDVLGRNWSSGGRDEARRRLLAEPGRAVGLALLDQKSLAGVGNEYRAEICFLCGIHPATPIGRVDVDQVLDVTRRVMWANRLSPVRVITGDNRPGRTSYVFGRNRRPCRRCGTAIRKDTLGGEPGRDLERIIWWCPTCQPSPGGAAA
ncbi:DNA-formamidopyrimidine glycosylase family protein [uncultured Corynebacterium sp.]|uniref:DNA-formamidopyrimidine glycosylase family protein n=1 Tax=uncultured Corynebacterium sp. TaxID=159447 RepID=UPI0025E41D78|nr:DNA-formamidopyrimidine glycosylase family protein [uncultured Corynebacterium sp.]